MKREEIKKSIDREIEKACEMKAIDFTTLNMDKNLNLLESGIFDSLGILQLISNIENELNTEIDLSEYSPSEFTNYQELISIFQDSLKKKISEIES